MLRFDVPDVARQLETLAGPHPEVRPLVLLAPGGPADLARELAIRLRGDLDVLLAAPFELHAGPATVSGAVAESGALVLDDDSSSSDQVKQDEMAEAIFNRLLALAERRGRLTPWRGMHSPDGRRVVLVAPAVASGTNVRRAIALLRSQGATRVAVVLGAAPRRAVDRLRGSADSTVCARTFETVSSEARALRGWRRTPDSETRRVLRRSEHRKGGGA